jgi:hypothetical protein
MNPPAVPLRREIVLLRDLPAEGLRQGDIGTIVEVYSGSAGAGAGSASSAPGYEVEFFTAAGRTRAVESLSADDFRPIADSDVLSVRSMDGIRE